LVIDNTTDGSKHFVTGLMAEIVVDQFESVKVHDKQLKSPAGAAGP